MKSLDALLQIQSLIQQSSGESPKRLIFPKNFVNSVHNELVGASAIGQLRGSFMSHSWNQFTFNGTIIESEDAVVPSSIGGTASLKSSAARLQELLDLHNAGLTETFLGQPVTVPKRKGYQKFECTCGGEALGGRVHTSKCPPEKPWMRKRQKSQSRDVRESI